jgi:hypothetical protein
MTTSTDKQDAAPAMCKCGKNPAEPPHICPYQYEINDSEATCDCCAECASECAMDI